MNRITNILLLTLALSLVQGCNKRVGPDDGPQDFIEINVGGYNVAAKNAGAIDELTDFGTDKVAVWGLSYVVGNSIAWSDVARIISTQTATIATDGKIDYGTKVVFPETRVALYSLYPAEVNKGVTINETPATSAPSAAVVLGSTPATQYDIMVATLPDLKREEAKNANLEFQHTLARLDVKIIAEAAVDGSRTLTKVVVKAPLKATMTDVTTGAYSSVQDAEDIVLYESTTGIVIPQVGEGIVPIAIPGSLMLMPNPAQVSEIALTIDGEIYTVPVAAKADLQKGKLNTINLTLKPLGVVFGTFSINAWGTGTGGSSNADNMVMTTDFKVGLKLADAVTNWTPNNANALTAEIEIDGVYTLLDEDPNNDDDVTDATDKIKCTYTNGVLALYKKLPTGKLNADDVLLTGLKIYDAGTLVFEAKAISGVTTAMVIDSQTGELKVGGSVASMNMGFGGFGQGTQAAPFEICNALHLDNVRKFLGTANARYFKQLVDIDLTSYLVIAAGGTSATAQLGDAGGWIPIGTSASPFCGDYDGNNHTIKGLFIKRAATYQGLFGYVSKPTSFQNKIQKLIIETGNIDVAGIVGTIAGYIKNGSIEYCTSKINIKVGSDGYAGGIVGDLQSSDVKYCNNSSTLLNSIGGPCVGGIAGNALGASILYCNNTAEIKSQSTQLGGIAGYIATSEVIRCANTGKVSTLISSSYAGGIVGQMNTPSPARVHQSKNNGEVSGNGFTGGIVGGAAASMVIEESVNAGFVYSLGGRVAGITGAGGASASVLNCYNIGAVKMVNVNVTSTLVAVGGMMGYSTSSSSVQNSYNRGLIQQRNVADNADVNGVAWGSVVGFFNASSVAAKVVNNYGLTGSAPTLVGIGNKVGQTGLEFKDAAWFTSADAVTTLNSGTTVWTQVAGKNDGYPILKWEIE